VEGPPSPLNAALMTTETESDQIRQRRDNLDELVRLGVNPYPHEFPRTHTIAELVETHGSKTGAELEAERVETTTAGRILAIRSCG
jgi:lysyl-tRNA synthetase class 2